MIGGLCDEYDFTVFAVKFANPRPDRIRFIRVPAPERPLALLFIMFHVLAPLYYLVERIRSRQRFDLVQFVETNCFMGTISYTQFCHRRYLREHWKRSRPMGLRRFFRWLDHSLHAALEPVIFRKARHVVVPSSGLARELAAEYPSVAPKLHLIPNPVDTDHLAQASEAHRGQIRHALDIPVDSVVLLFAALGHFERKGLPLILEALRKLNSRRLHLIVAGGSQGLVNVYRRVAADKGLGPRISFVGPQPDLKPFFSASDVFIFPSWYETFSLVTFEAAAAGLPIIATRLHGVEGFLRDGQNGYLVDRTVEAIERGLRQMIHLTPEERSALGANARLSVQKYGLQEFTNAWRSFYRNQALLQCGSGPTQFCGSGVAGR
jgi:glycosyltransferase involved in cell wall biosynthesis